MKAIVVDIGNKHAGMLITVEDRQVTVLTHGKDDRREVTFDDPADAAAEAFTQARTLKLYTKLMDRCTALTRGRVKNFGDYLRGLLDDPQ